MFHLLRNIPDDGYFCRARAVSDWRVREDDKGLKLEIDVPGYSEEDISVEVNRSTIYVEVKLKEREGRYSYKIPGDIDYEMITALVVNGVLKIRLPFGKRRKIL